MKQKQKKKKLKKHKHKEKKTGGIRTKPRPRFIGEPLSLEIDD